MKWVNSFLDRLQSTSTLDQVQNLITELRDDLGVEHAIYHIVGYTGREFGALTYAPDWVDHYKSERYFLVDPVVQTAIRSLGPVDWCQLDWTPPPARKVIGEAVAGGVGKNGYSVPVRGVNGELALFSVTSYDRDPHWQDFGKSNLRGLILAANMVHEHIGGLMGTDTLNAPADLSPRERDVLTFLSIGKSRSEAAETLGISEHTLRAYLDSARVKLRARNTVHAVAVAMAQGVILP